MAENPQPPLDWSELREGVEILLSGATVDQADLEAIVHPFQAVDVYITPTGWFSRLLWRFIRFEMAWEKKPFKVYREVP